MIRLERWRLYERSVKSNLGYGACSSPIHDNLNGCHHKKDFSLSTILIYSFAFQNPSPLLYYYALIFYFINTMPLFAFEKHFTDFLF
jgi:hypothetical protein